MPPKGKRASTGSMPAAKRKRDDRASLALGEISGNSLSAGRARETSLFRKLKEARTSSTTDDIKANALRVDVAEEVEADPDPAVVQDETQQMLRPSVAVAPVQATLAADDDSIPSKADSEELIPREQDRANRIAEVDAKLDAIAVRSKEQERELMDRIDKEETRKTATELFMVGFNHFSNESDKTNLYGRHILQWVEEIGEDVDKMMSDDTMDARFKSLHKKIGKLEEHVRRAEKDRTTIFEVLNDRVKRIEATMEERFERQNQALEALLRSQLTEKELLDMPWFK